MGKKFFDLSGISIGKHGEVEQQKSSIRELDEKYHELISGGDIGDDYYDINPGWDFKTNDELCSNRVCGGDTNLCANTVNCNGGSNDRECTNGNVCETTTNSRCINASCDGAKNSSPTNCIG